MIILDTNVVSELMKPAPAAAVVSWTLAQPTSDLFTTAITEAEIYFGIELLPRGKRREQLRAAAEAFFEEAFCMRVFPFDSSASREFARVAARRQVAGRPAGFADAQIVAIARVHRAAVATRDTADFDGCDIYVVNPWKA